jgi:hypothetical protein
MSEAEKNPSVTSEEASSREPEEIRQEIDETREELGETVAAVAEKTDVKKQARDKADELKSQAGERAEEVKAKAQENPMPLALAGAFATGLMVGRLLWR